MDVDDLLDALGLRGLFDTTDDASTREQPEINPDQDEREDSTDEETGPEQPDSGDDGGADADQDLDEAIEDEFADIRHELTQLDDRIDTNESNIKSIEASNEDIKEQIGTLEEHDAQLLSVYDRLTPGVNPFADDWDEDHEFSNDGDSPYNVVSPEDVEGDDGGEDADGSVSVDDLKDDYQTSNEEDEEGTTGDDTSPAPSERTVPDPDDLSHDPEPETNAGPVQKAPPSGQNAYLSDLTPAYATEVLLMEWVDMLIEKAGPAGALKTLDHYERIDWISPAVKLQLEDLLSGATVTADSGEIDVRDPSDLTTDEHSESFAYLIKLEQVQKEERH